MLCALLQEEQLAVGTAEREHQLRAAREGAAATEQRAAALLADAQTQANRIVRALGTLASQL